MAFGGFAPLPLRLGGGPIHGWTAAQYAAMCSAMVAMVRRAKLASVTVEQTGATTGNLLAYNGQNGVGEDYAPAVAFLATGDIRITFDDSWEDAYGNVHPVNIKRCRVSCGAGAMRWRTWEIESPTTIRIRTFNAAGVADSAAVTVTVY